MVSFKTAATAVASALLLAGSALADVDPIVIKGSKFFYKTNGTEFFIRGVAYQQNVGGNNSEGDATGAKFVDPLADAATCKRDIPYLTQLRTNVVRVYAIDTTQSHDDCMQQLQQAGIYVIADLGAPNISINRVDPAWNDALYARYTSVVDLMAKYSNTLGFFAGNEVANNASNAQAIPFVKAAVRDMKRYIKQKNYRPIGVGYAADDGAAIRVPVRDYVNCGPADSSVDFFGYNIYSWCGTSENNKYQTSGYADRTKEFANYNVPVFFAEYGCNQPSPRAFDDTKALFSSQMTPVWSGGIVYEYFQEDNKYGMLFRFQTRCSQLANHEARPRLHRRLLRLHPLRLQEPRYGHGLRVTLGPEFRLIRADQHRRAHLPRRGVGLVDRLHQPAPRAQQGALQLHGGQPDLHRQVFRQAGRLPGPVRRGVHQERRLRRHHEERHHGHVRRVQHVRARRAAELGVQ